MDAVLGASIRWRSALVLALLLLAMLWARDFTVDDALISVRYARNVARGLGWRFNPADAPSDGVTPLPWPLVLAPAGRFVSGVALLGVAKLLGALAVLWAALSVLRRLEAEGAPAGALALLLPFPLVAWAVSGMETGLATALATTAACQASLGWAALAAGLATTLRPELLPWALVLVGARAALLRERRAALAVAGALVPFALVVMVRLVCFGRTAPLAVLAKPSDLAHGATYAAAAALACGTPLLLLAPWRRGVAPVALAACTHLLVIIVIGGDWMPYARLLVPILPSLALVPSWRGTRARVAWALSTTTALLVGWRAAPNGVHVGAARAQIVASLRGLPVPIAALDVGFVAVAAGDGTVIDLGGLTDLELAILPGGQTSKRIDLAMIEQRGARAVLVLGQHGSRLVEQRIVYDPRFEREFVGREIGRLGAQPVWLYERRAER